MYAVFTRNFWKRDQTGQLQPDPQAPRSYLRRDLKTPEEARKICQEYNSTHAWGPLSRKAEFEET